MKLLTLFDFLNLDIAVSLFNVSAMLIKPLHILDKILMPFQLLFEGCQQVTSKHWFRVAVEGLDWTSKTCPLPKRYLVVTIILTIFITF